MKISYPFLNIYALLFIYILICILLIAIIHTVSRFYIKIAVIRRFIIRPFLVPRYIYYLPTILSTILTLPINFLGLF